ncbi:MAG: hypothetical protein H8D46_02460 [FCB group bacterium]|nr:hypothetical protein [FCB group bacterium]
MTQESASAIPKSCPTRGIDSWTEGQQFYCISNVDRMAPFLMSITSPGNHWMYVSSLGGLTAGRINEEGCLFPYETEDRLHYCHTFTGPVTHLSCRVGENQQVFWQPFSDLPLKKQITRNLYKTAIGNQVIFEEINHQLGLAFRYRWTNSDQHGFIRSCMLETLPFSPVTHIKFLDGFRNIMPSGVELFSQQGMSNLVDAYKYSEIEPGTQMGIFSLAALMMDRPEPGEALRASVVWCSGLKKYAVTLSEEIITDFLAGKPLQFPTLRKGKRGAYIIHSEHGTEPGSVLEWHLVTDVSRNQTQVDHLVNTLQKSRDQNVSLDSARKDSTDRLTAALARADAFQKTSISVADQHHTANVLFNIMRGGVFADHYRIDMSDFSIFVKNWNRKVYKVHRGFLSEFPESLLYWEILEKAETTGDPDLVRLVYEYLPLFFSRRHGDPSRPWNRFAIHVTDDAGGLILNYQGNWRDIFQNWEALALSYPEFIEAFIAKFVNASTLDGYNPYRITRDGIDWEKIDPNDPWAFIGYWGDHQIIYLLKFLEMSAQYHPDALDRLLEKRIFTYANVPYRIKPYEDLVANSKRTINFDRELDQKIEQLVSLSGADGKLIQDSSGEIVHVTLLEKLLVPALSKLSNLIPDGGIWLNTQRPEWNDANNAIVGNGLSMVTHFYLRRYVNFLENLLLNQESDRYEISSQVADWMFKCSETFLELNNSSQDTLTDQTRRQFIDAVGTIFSQYRSRIYTDGFSGIQTVSREQILDFLSAAKHALDRGIRSNQRDDRLYHSYNLISMASGGETASLSRLYEMLEGQVAAISSGILDTGEIISLVESLFTSKLYREDQHSFVLYPVRDLPGFLEKNRISKQQVDSCRLLTDLVKAEDTSILQQNDSGDFHFNADLRNAGDLRKRLSELGNNPGWASKVEQYTDQLLDIYEQVFNHHAFTGRSGSMYAYEGIGSIYWHMVAKLLLAVQSHCLTGIPDGDNDSLKSLVDLYYRIRNGLGFNKSPGDYGAFPYDPYSHTPGDSGAKQPGMTGQVKEEILTRFGELGLSVKKGKLSFNPKILRKMEFLTQQDDFDYFDLCGKAQCMKLSPGSLAFSYCQIPVIYQLSGQTEEISLHFSDITSQSLSGNSLNEELSLEIFRRSGKIKSIFVQIPETKIKF